MKELAKVVASDTPTFTQNLDLKDKRILSILCKNSRTPSTIIAHTLGYSEEVVTYRLKKMIEQNIITDFFTSIDSTKLGFLKVNIYLEFSSLSKDDEARIVEFFIQHDNISWIISTSGKWDFMIQLYVKSIDNLDAILLATANKFVDLLKSYEVFIITQFHHLAPQYLTQDIILPDLNRLPYEKELEGTHSEIVNIDSTDIKILKLLEADARTPVLAISHDLKLSKDAVIYRIKKMIRQGIIQRFLLRLNYHALGYEYHSILLKLKNVDEEKRKTIISFLKNKKEVIAIFVQIGSWNLAVQTIVKNAIELKSFLSELKEAFNKHIEDSDTVLYFNQYYFTYLPRIIMKEYEDK